LPQWNDFFGKSRIDPIKDFDRLLIWGPDFRDSSNLVVILKHELPESEVRSTVDALVSRTPGGGWIEGDVPAARARADRADRVVVMPSPGWVVIAPATAEKSVLRIRQPNLPAAKGPEAVVGSLAKPYHAFRKARIPVEIPKTIKIVRFQVVPQPDGGALATFVAQDASPEDARRSLDALNAQLDKVRAWGILGALFGGGVTSVLLNMQLSVEGSEILGTVPLNRAELSALLATVEGQLGLTPPPAVSAGPSGSSLPPRPWPVPSVPR
jgi:hypothetical protein